MGRSQSGRWAVQEDPLDYDTVVGGLHVISLDSSVAGKVSGALAPTQIAWLKARLAAQ
jgi:Icc protein